MKNFGFLRNLSFTAMWDRKRSILANVITPESFRIIFIIAAELYLSNKPLISCPEFLGKIAKALVTV